MHISTRTWTRIARGALSFLVLMTLAAAPLFYLESVESAQDWPELAYLQWPALLGTWVLLGLAVACEVMLGSTIAHLGAGTMTSPAGLRSLQRLRTLLAVLAGYLVAAAIGFWLLSGFRWHPGLVLEWLTLESVALVGAGLTTMTLRGLRNDPEAAVSSATEHVTAAR